MPLVVSRWQCWTDSLLIYGLYFFHTVKVEI